MNFRKILATVAASALAVSLFAFPVNAADDYVIDATVKEGVTWADTVTPTTISGNGTYDVSIDTTSLGANNWGYFWLYSADKAPAGYDTATIKFNSFKVNGVDWPIVKGDVMPFLQRDDGRLGELPVFNVWNKDNSVADLTNTTPSGDLVSFLDADGNAMVVTSFDVNFTIDGVDGVFADGGAVTTTSSPATGNMPIALIGGAAIAALIGMVVSRKK
jgi:hypothetical protein